jgi:hypothetical protein
MKSPQKKSSTATLDKLARAYREKGYTVLYQPSESDLPAFLGSFRPDLIALSTNDNVVVEVKSRKQVTGSEQVIELAELIESKPGWRYELIFDRPSSAERIEIIRSKPTLTKQEIVGRLATARRLLEEGFADSALLLGWSAAEAVFRRLLHYHDIPLENLKSSYLIKTLYSNGLIGWRMYEQIQKAFATRNQIAHGFKPKDLDEKSIEHFLTLIEERTSELDMTDSTVTVKEGRSIKKHASPKTKARSTSRKAKKRSTK